MPCLSRCSATKDRNLRGNAQAYLIHERTDSFHCVSLLRHHEVVRSTEDLSLALALPFWIMAHAFPQYMQHRGTLWRHQSGGRWTSTVTFLVEIYGVIRHHHRRYSLYGIEAIHYPPTPYTQKALGLVSVYASSPRPKGHTVRYAGRPPKTFCFSKSMSDLPGGEIEQANGMR